MFVNNKYTIWYYNIITTATQHNRRKLSRDHINYVYYENHHIIPRSLGGGDDITNLVLLTPKEHYMCHMLLTKMCIHKSHSHNMNLAYNMMSNYNGTTTSKMYHRIKQSVYATISEHMSGVPKSAISIQKMVATRRKNGSYMHTSETKLKMIESHKSRPAQSTETRAKKSESLRGRQFTDTHRQAISKGLAGREPWNKGIRTGPKLIPVSNDTRQKISMATRGPKATCCCLNCHREISINNLDRHQNSKLCHSAIKMNL